MPIPHPRRRLGGGGLLDQRGHVWDWAPQGWYWEVLPFGGGSLVWSQPVVDPNLLWWRSGGPVTVRRLEDPAGVVRQRGGRARPSLHGCVGGQVLQYLAGSSGISLEL